MYEQISFFDTPNVITEEEITRALWEGSGVTGGKKRINLFFLQQPSHPAAADFLRKEYGIGGCVPAYPGTDLWMDHDGNGITLKANKRGFIKREISWSEAERRIREMVENGTYMQGGEL